MSVNKEKSVNELTK